MIVVAMEMGDRSDIFFYFELYFIRIIYRYTLNAISFAIVNSSVASSVASRLDIPCK